MPSVLLLSILLLALLASDHLQAVEMAGTYHSHLGKINSWHGLPHPSYRALMGYTPRQRDQGSQKPPPNMEFEIPCIK